MAKKAKTAQEVEVLSVAQAAALAHVTTKAIYQWIENGWVEAVPSIEGVTVLRRDAVEAQIAKGRTWRVRGPRPNGKVSQKKRERKAKALEMMQSDPHVPLTEIAAKIGVTEMTVWRDTKELRGAGVVGGNARDGWRITIEGEPGKARRPKAAAGASQADG